MFMLYLPRIREIWHQVTLNNNNNNDDTDETRNTEKKHRNQPETDVEKNPEDKKTPTLKL